jgi:hypothetical protein
VGTELPATLATAGTVAPPPPPHAGSPSRALGVNAKRLIHSGYGIGPATAEAVTQLMVENRHPVHDYRAGLGLRLLARSHGKPRLEVACVCL